MKLDFANELGNLLLFVKAIVLVAVYTGLAFFIAAAGLMTWFKRQR